MNKNEIKQIILEEIEAALQEMNESMTPEDMAADSRPEEDNEIEGPGWEDMPGAKVHPFVGDQEARIARAMETGDEDELEDLAAGELDRAGLEEMARTANVFALARKSDMGEILRFMMLVNKKLKTYKSPGQKRPKKRFTEEEMRALAKVMTQPEGFTSKDIIAATSYNSPAQANKFLAALEQKGLIKLTSQLKKSMEPERDPNAPETRGRKAKSAEFDMPDDALDMDFGDFDDLDLGDIGALEENNNIWGDHIQNARNIIKLLGGIIFDLDRGRTEEVKKALHKDAKPSFFELAAKIADKDFKENISGILRARVKNDLKTIGIYLKKALESAEKYHDYILDKYYESERESKDLPIEFYLKENNTMPNLEKYIRQQIKEAKNPLAKKMKEIENQGRVAALETKLAAVAEMIEETNGRLTRIDEDNEFADMMDKNAVKEVRKQLKELERAQAKLQKEYDKAAGGRKKETVVDEDAPVAEDAVDIAVDEVELEEDNFALSESVKRMQKLANLKG